MDVCCCEGEGGLWVVVVVVMEVKLGRWRCWVRFVCKVRTCLSGFTGGCFSRTVDVDSAGRTGSDRWAFWMDVVKPQPGGLLADVE
ncbi:unnamed protein product [Arctogadus glacialis]